MLIIENLKVTADIISAKEKEKKIFRKRIQMLSKEDKENLLKETKNKYSKALKQQENPSSSADMNNPYIDLYKGQIEVLEEELCEENRV